MRRGSGLLAKGFLHSPVVPGCSVGPPLLRLRHSAATKPRLNGTLNHNRA